MLAQSSVYGLVGLETFGIVTAAVGAIRLVVLLSNWLTRGLWASLLALALWR